MGFVSPEAGHDPMEGTPFQTPTDRETGTIMRTSRAIATVSFSVSALCFSFFQTAAAGSLSENIAAFVAAERKVTVPVQNSFSFEDSRKETAHFAETEQPMGALRVGNINFTAYANARPSFSYQFNENASLTVKTSRNSAVLWLQVNW